MDDKDFSGLMAGLTEAAAHIRGEDVPGARVHIPDEIDTKALRARLGKLTQAQFAQRFGLSLGAVRDWEQGRAMPDRTTRTLLKVIAVDPEVVMRAVEAA